MAEYIYVTSTGTIIADTADLRAQNEQVFKDAFGQDLTTADETPQGVVINQYTAVDSAVIRNNAALGNQINPNISGGVFLDAVCALTGLPRDGASRSLVNATLTGIPNTVIPAGSLATTTSNNQFQALSAVVIPISGTTTAIFESVEFGPIPCLTGQLTTIVTSVLGWESINNTEPAAAGTLVQSDLSLRNLRVRTLALQGSSTSEAIYSRMSDVQGVTSLTFLENVSNTTQVIENVSLVAHSIWACVDGGTTLDVANAIYNAKSGGCNYNGSLTQVVIDQYSQQSQTVKFERPTEIDFMFRVTVKYHSSIADPIASVKEAIITYANGGIEGEVGLVVGADVSPYEISAAININNPRLFVVLVEIAEKSGSPVWQTATYELEIFEVARIAEADIQVILV